MSNSIGLYIHIPFCKHKCPYCDFFSGNADENAFDNYVIELKDKIKYWSEKAKRDVATVYFGGGTPSILGADRLCDILDFIKVNFNIQNDAEITVEVNPDSAKTIDFEKMYACGFNRISMGMQTAVEDELRLLGRIHSIDDAKTSVERAKSAGFNNISLDLMMGIPNQTIESLQNSIKFCADCGVAHISSYILKIEENTPFYKMQNKLSLADDDMQAEMYLKAVEMLDSLGYMQYEISNFAKLGFESHHNTNYWKCGEYIGIGPSAHSFFEGKRFFYSRSMDDFNNNKLSFEGTGGDEEEFIMLSLRLKSGLNYSEFEEKFGYSLPSYITDKAKEYEKYGYMNVTNKTINFTPKGFLVSNSIISELI
jgi:oxygen-independent coproporphyrinogen-3 oxidase|nr:radical SAM family heme chaperone HemW [Ruminococcus bromii]